MTKPLFALNFAACQAARGGRRGVVTANGKGQEAQIPSG